MKRVFWLLPALLIAFSATSLLAGEIAPDLQEQWSKVAPDAKVKAIFHLWERVDLREMDIMLRNMKVTRQQRHQIVVEELQRVARDTQPPLLNDLDALRERHRIDGFTPYWITNCVVVKGERSVLVELIKHPSVRWVEAVPVMELIEPVRSTEREQRQSLDSRPPGVNAVHAPRVWNELGYTGEGVLVANMDTGVDGNHVALGSRWRGNHAPHSECWLDVLGGGSQTPVDAQSHGTHVMGTICGTGGNGSQFDTIGVAPGAEWIAMNAIGGFGGDFTSDVLQGYQWFADPDENPETIEDVPDVIQNSWGVYSSLGYPDCFNDWNTAIIACETAGTVVTFSAGNEGPGAATHRSPANIALDSVTFFSVGSVNAGNYPAVPHPISSFSSRGPSDCDGTQIKPEIVAPGENVYSSVPGGYSGSFSGTSMAGPHIAGVVALMREANPNADVREIKSVLMQTAIDYGTAGDDNTYGRGMVDAYEAVLMISADRGWVVGQITNQSNGQPIAGARVQAGDNYIRYSDAQGNYRISLPADSLLPFSISAFGFAQYNSEFSVADSDTVVLDIAMSLVPSGVLLGTVEIGNAIPVQFATVTPQFVPVEATETDENGEFSFVLPGENNYSFVVEFQGLQAETTLFVATNDTTEALIQFTTPRSQSVGPDSSGYRAYDRYDYGLPAQYNWADMTNATELEFPQISDASSFVEMPFPFVFYGRAYDSITVNENGWVAPGEDPDRRNANTAIPAPQGPAGMLALFWDNLVLGLNPVDSRILTRYDQPNGVFIIEYDHLYFVPITANHLTAQIHIFDQEVWPTPTGDCEIMFVYDNVDIQIGGTVGIESPTETYGLQLQYNTVLNDSSFAIQQGSAILFTTRTLDRSTGNLTGTITTHPPISEAIANGVRVGNRMGQVAANGSFSLQDVFAGPRTLRVQIPGYEFITAEATVVAGQTTSADAEVWRLDPPQNLTYTRTNDSLFMSWDAPESVGGLDELSSYIVHINEFVLASTTALEFRTRIPSGDAGHYFWLTAMYEGGESIATDTIHVVQLDAENPSVLPLEYALAPAYPNPFNPTTALEVSLPQNAHLSLRVFDITGREVTTVASGLYTAGVHRFTWNAAGVATGVYFARLESPLGTHMQKLLLLK